MVPAKVKVGVDMFWNKQVAGAGVGAGVGVVEEFENKRLDKGEGAPTEEIVDTEVSEAGETAVEVERVKWIVFVFAADGQATDRGSVCTGQGSRSVGQHRV
jgi:hypothetical protein